MVALDAKMTFDDNASGFQQFDEVIYSLAPMLDCNDNGILDAEEIAGHPRERKRFLKEARIVAGLKHSNIIEIYSVLEEGGGLYLATTGVGVRRPGVDLGMHRIEAGDRILVSGPIGAEN